MTVGLISLGCAKNRVDSEQMLSVLTQAGHSVVTRPEDADILIVNTCGFIDQAKEESIDRILEMAGYKQTGRCRLLIVTGCLSQRYRDTLKAEFPEVDLLLGVNEYSQLPGLIERALKGDKGEAAPETDGFLECGRVLTTPPYSAYVRVAEGCDNRCSYCAIPLIRGGFRSRPVESILSEMRDLASRGVAEQMLISQDTSRFGTDIRGPRLKDLVRMAADIPGITWLRVLYCYPDEIDEELIDAMAANPRVCRYLDLPLQHASPRILKAMRRRGDINRVKKLLSYARDKGFALRTTFIVGFPGETEEDFEELLAFTRDMAFDRMGAFTYSREEDTPAYDMEDQVPEDVAKSRHRRLMALQRDIALASNERRLGEIAQVLVTGKQGRLYTGRSAWEAPDADGLILFSSDKNLSPGDYVSVRLTEALPYDMKGIHLSEEERLS